MKASHELSLSWSQQSPIELGGALHTTELPSFEIQYPKNKKMRGAFDEHHNFVFDTPGPAAVIHDGIRCPLVRMHFHAPSEHVINGKTADFEAHLIHKVPSFPEGFPSAAIVLGIFFDLPKGDAHRKDAGHAALHELFSQWASKTPEGPIKIDPSLFLPENVSQYYRYEGSLTTKPYSEFVSWFVLRDHSVLDTASEILVKEGTHHDNREIQPLNRRFVLRNFK